MTEAYKDKVDRLTHEPRIEAGHSAEQEKLLAELNKQAKAEKDPSVTLQEALGRVQTAEQLSVAADPLETIQAAQEAAAAAPVQKPSRDMIKLTQSRSIKQLQRQEKFTERTLSKIIHQPAVRVVSEATGKTLSRPSGLLGGGITALIGTSAYLYLAKHLGFEYNYFIFLVLFAGGFVFGLVLELIVAVALRGKHHQA